MFYKILQENLDSSKNCWILREVSFVNFTTMLHFTKGPMLNCSCVKGVLVMLLNAKRSAFIPPNLNLRCLMDTILCLCIPTGHDFLARVGTLSQQQIFNDLSTSLNVGAPTNNFGRRVIFS